MGQFRARRAQITINDGLVCGGSTLVHTPLRKHVLSLIHGSVTKPLIWAACFAVIALIVAGLMFCFSQSPNHVHLPFDSRPKAACFSESCLLSTGSLLHNPAAQRLLFSRRQVDSAGDTCKTSAVSRGSTPRNDVQCPSAMSAASSGRPVPLPRGFLSCHGLPLDDARGDLGRSSRSLAADGPSWPPILLLERSEPSLELQVQFLTRFRFFGISVKRFRGRVGF
ncbi:uncharacterized protein LOC142817618 [Rhipicephalus microplus]|uniref:uncharacterized protein LOC142817618 n=1 Tax=Rhipicephalus microplus TaxID=6941 RepID=UPI003F6D4647